MKGRPLTPGPILSKRLTQASHKSGVWRVRRPGLALGSHLELASCPILPGQLLKGPNHLESSEVYKAQVGLQSQVLPSHPTSLSWGGCLGTMLRCGFIQE